MAHQIILISTERSGTNFHQSILRHSLTPAVVLREIFNPSFPFGLESVKPPFLQALRETSGVEMDLENRPALARFFREDPRHTIRCLDLACERIGAKFLSWTLFQSHIGEHELSDILYENDCSCVFLTRSRLARYVSLVKARQLGAWRRVDTTSLKVEIDLEDFLTAARNADDWFQRTSELAVSAGVQMRQLSYSGDLDLPAQEAFAALERQYRGICGLKNLKPERIREFKQDRNANVFAAISNAQELRNAFEDASLRAYAFAEPAVFGTEPSSRMRGVTDPESAPDTPEATVRP